MKLWTAEVAHSPFAATPLITDMNANGMLDIIAAPLSETQTVLEAETGTTLKNTKWPTQMLDSSIFASPLQVSVSGDLSRTTLMMMMMMMMMMMSCLLPM
ncbi:hypothetical protein DPMN_037987 [Dreissena polymorpha]|uniref:Uncharacterized protein n=1 Tax=Dreissena polymorpha TaxID=45954 RepID=A0A9D4MFH2_DREPO|nr:hypothetical protein DPMN_037987 [Dreissena polymorpha]